MRRGDADMLKYCIDNDKGVKDCMVKVFSSRDHGFNRVGISSGDDDDDSTADRAGGKKKKDVTSDFFLDEEFRGGVGTGANRDNDSDVIAIDAEVA